MEPIDCKATERNLRELALFAGSGGGILGGTLLGWKTVCAVERDAYCAAVLAQRQADGCLPIFPIWSIWTRVHIDQYVASPYMFSSFTRGRVLQHRCIC